MTDQQAAKQLCDRTDRSLSPIRKDLRHILIKGFARLMKTNHHS